MMFAMSNEVRKSPCEACPYRRDVPSGVWASHEYDKLRAYDGEPFDQPPNGFACHATPEKFCHGWAVVSGPESLALRIAGGPELPPPKVPLFDTHAEAADHGQREVESPSYEAGVVVDRLKRKHSRLRGGPV